MSLSPIPYLPFAANPSEWESFRPHYDRLLEQPLTPDTIDAWLQEWSELSKVITEVGSVTYIETTLDTTDTDKEKAFLAFIENVEPQQSVADQALKERLIAYTAEYGPLDGQMALPLRNIRNQASLFRNENVALATELAKLGNEYDKITGGMTFDWDGEEKNLNQLNTLTLDKDRSVRQRAWEAIMGLWAEQREVLNELYGKMLAIRQQVAENADLPNFRAYTFLNYNRFDYTPEDCLVFHEAIEKVVVPAATRIYERKQRELGVDTLRPWDLEVETSDAPSLTPYQGQDALIQGSLDIFEHVDASLARYFATMAEDGLLDLDTRTGKALGGYCTTLPLRERPFIFMNGDGTHDDVQTMLHEAGHAFHAFESFALPLIWMADVPMEFAEVASMSMELLSAPYLTKDFNGFYTEAEAARARRQHLSSILTFLPYMAVVDAFQHWVYTHPNQASDPAECDVAWDDLWNRFMPGVDWSGFEDARTSGWHRKLHIFHVPFYYVEYGMAQVGALQVWRNALSNQEQAVADYRSALALGGTEPLPDLFAAAGAEFRFDEAMLTDLVALIERTITELDQVA
ncbi:MAG: M3 family oligoendopeptidase [Chloroflexota bacterium]